MTFANQADADILTLQNRILEKSGADDFDLRMQYYAKIGEIQRSKGASGGSGGGGATAAEVETAVESALADSGVATSALQSALNDLFTDTGNPGVDQADQLTWRELDRRRLIRAEHVKSFLVKTIDSTDASSREIIATPGPGNRLVLIKIRAQNTTGNATRILFSHFDGVSTDVSVDVLNTTSNNRDLGNIVNDRFQLMISFFGNSFYRSFASGSAIESVANSISNGIFIGTKLGSSPSFSRRFSRLLFRCH